MPLNFIYPNKMWQIFDNPVDKEFTKLRQVSLALILNALISSIILKQIKSFYLLLYFLSSFKGNI